MNRLRHFKLDVRHPNFKVSICIYVIKALVVFTSYMTQFDKSTLLINIQTHVINTMRVVYFPISVVQSYTICSVSLNEIVFLEVVMLFNLCLDMIPNFIDNDFKMAFNIHTAVCRIKFVKSVDKGT